MVENEFDVWYSTLNSKQKKMLEKFSFGLIAVGEKRGRVEGAKQELELIENEFFPMINVDGKKYVNFESLNKYFKKRLKNLEMKK